VSHQRHRDDGDRQVEPPQWAARLDAVFAALLAAGANSVLPREPQNAVVLEEALIAFRTSA
jgi:hypothetical protein